MNLEENESVMQVQLSPTKVILYNKESKGVIFQIGEMYFHFNKEQIEGISILIDAIKQKD